MSIQVKEFKWEKGKNDLEYIKLLESALKRQKQITAKALGRIKQLTREKQNRKLLMPCDLCIWSPPSSTDNKPCAMCSAQAYPMRKD